MSVYPKALEKGVLKMMHAVGGISRISFLCLVFVYIKGPTGLKVFVSTRYNNLKQVIWQPIKTHYLEEINFLSCGTLGLDTLK